MADVNAIDYTDVRCGIVSGEVSYCLLEFEISRVPVGLTCIVSDR